MKRVSFNTVGCRLNQAETAALTGLFVEYGYEVVPFDAPADVCVIHTCAITAAAEKECARLARRARRRNPDAVVALAGCACEVSGEQLRTASSANLILGHADKYRLPQLIENASAPPINHHPSTISPAPSTINQPSPVPRFDTTRAWVKAQDGCSFGCAYCIVPHARGPARSRPLDEVVAEAAALSDAGHREMVITGANLGTYQDGKKGLVDLLQRVEAIPGIARLRISSIELSTTEHEVIDYMADSAKLCRFLHLPLQTGDDRLLRAMGRRYTVSGYRRMIDHVIDRMPRAGIGTDLVTGLPGEDDAAFRNTHDLVEALPFSNLHVFPYSPRPGTRAASMPDQVRRDVARRRANRLIALGAAKREAFARGFIRRQVEVLVEAVDAHGTGAGWTAEYLRATIHQPGIAPNTIVRVAPNRVEGEELFIQYPSGR